MKIKKYKTILLCIVLLLIIYIFKIPCPIYKITHLYCPGCGITRSLVALFHLNLYQSFRYNPLIFILYPFIFPYCIYKIYIYLFDKNDKVTNKIPKVIIKFLIILLIVYGVIRNFDIFSYLAPTKI